MGGEGTLPRRVSPTAERLGALPEGGSPRPPSAACTAREEAFERRAFISYTGKLAVTGGAREKRSRRVWLAFMALTSFCARGHGNGDDVTCVLVYVL